MVTVDFFHIVMILQCCSSQLTIIITTSKQRQSWAEVCVIVQCTEISTSGYMHNVCINSQNVYDEENIYNGIEQGGRIRIKSSIGLLLDSRSGIAAAIGPGPRSDPRWGDGLGTRGSEMGRPRSDPHWGEAHVGPIYIIVIIGSLLY